MTTHETENQAARAELLKAFPWESAKAGAEAATLPLLAQAVVDLLGARVRERDVLLVERDALQERLAAAEREAAVARSSVSPVLSVTPREEMVARLAGDVFCAALVPNGYLEQHSEPAQIQRAVRLARQLVEEVERTGRGKMPQKIADPEPTCPGPNCVRCSGEYCDVHLTDPCDCGTVERHASDAVTRGLRDGGK